MIYYFSGTGNSEWVAKELAFLTGDEHEFIGYGNAPFAGTSIGLIFPIYAWGVPAPVEAFLKELKLSRTTYVYAVATCGSNCGNVDKQIENIIDHPVDAILSLSLPNNYIQGGDCDTDEVAREKFKAAQPKLRDFAGKIAKKEKGVKMVTRGPLPGLMTDIVHPLFLKVASSDKKFSVNDTCTSCGACVNNCPLQNITLVDGKPTWNGNCAQCTACINRCPQKAIQYGSSTPSRIRYYFKPEYTK